MKLLKDKQFIKDFVKSYLATASWVTADSDENTNFTFAAKCKAKVDCIEFINSINSIFGEIKATELLTIKGNDLMYLVPHDFFLTRNHHGTGYWDKQTIYGEYEAAKLTEISQKFKSVDCYHIKGKKSKLEFF